MNENRVTTITTPRLNLRMLQIEDAVELQALLERNKQEMLPWIPWAAEEPESVETKKKKIRAWKGEFYLDQKYIYGLFESSSSNHLIGLVFLFTRQGDGILEIGYILDKDHTGKGLTTEASYAVTKLGFKELAIEKMVIHCSPENTASARIPEKLGYQLELMEQSVTRDKNGSRSKNMIWALFNEEFMTIDKYEP